MNLKPLAKRLNDLRLGKLTETIFLQMFPAGCEQGVLLRAPLTGMKINYELPGFYKGQFQMIVRSPTYEDGEALAKRVIAALTLLEEQCGPQYFRYSRPLAQPVAFPLSVGNLVEYNVMFDVCFNEC